MGSLSDWGTFLLCWFANKSTPLTSKRCAFHHLLGALSEEAGSESKSWKWVLKPFAFDHHPLTYFFRTKHTDSPVTSVLVREAGLLRKCPLPYIHCLPSKLSWSHRRKLSLHNTWKEALPHTTHCAEMYKNKNKGFKFVLYGMMASMPRKMVKDSSELERRLWLTVLDPQPGRPEFLSQHPHPTPISQAWLPMFL